MGYTQEEEPVSLYYRTLTRTDQAFYKALVNGFRNYRTAIPAGSLKNFSDIMQDISASYPELFYLPIQMSAQGSFFGGKTVRIQYVYQKSDASRIRQQIDQVVDRFMKEYVDVSMADYDKAIAAHDYLRKSAVYDETAVNFSGGSPNRHFMESHSIVGPLINHTCVCEGYAKAFTYLCRNMGLECYSIYGTGNSAYERGPHMWNMVKISGFYHHVDVTWDKQFDSDPDMPNYSYFGLDDKTAARDHTWNRRYFPKSEECPGNFFHMNDALISSRAQLENFLRNSIESEEPYILFRVDPDSRFVMEIDGCLWDVMQAAQSRCRHVRVSSCQVQTFPEQHVYCVIAKYE